MLLMFLVHSNVVTHIYIPKNNVLKNVYANVAKLYTAIVTDTD